MAAIDLAEIAFRVTKQTGEDVDVTDFAYYVLDELTGDKITAYAMTKAKAPRDRKSVQSAATTFASKNAFKGRFLKEEISPFMKAWVNEYLKNHYGEHEEMIHALHKAQNPYSRDRSTAGLDNIEETEMTDEYFKRLLNRILVDISVSDLDKDSITAALQTIKLLKDRFDTGEKDENRIVIHMPAPFEGVCPHCRKEI